MHCLPRLAHSAWNVCRATVTHDTLAPACKVLALASTIVVVTGIRVESIGDYIRAQRRTARISLRQLADLAGVSNPYLSQIERGLRKPSAEILNQIAKGLRISAETLYVRAGILEERDGAPDVAMAVHADPSLTERQRRVLLDIYESFQRENASTADSTGRAGAPGEGAAPDVAGPTSTPTDQADESDRTDETETAAPATPRSARTSRRATAPRTRSPKTSRS